MYYVGKRNHQRNFNFKAFQDELSQMLKGFFFLFDSHKHGTSAFHYGKSLVRSKMGNLENSKIRQVCGSHGG